MGRGMTRKQQQERTRKALLRAAGALFAEHGLARTSIDDIAAAAGFTKGAFYANFDSKEALFLAMLEQRFAERIAALDAILAAEQEIEQQARAGAADFVRYLGADPQWQRLFFEFAAHAGRHETFRRELVACYRSLRVRIAELYRRRLERLGIDTPIPVDQLTLMTFAMANGIALEQLLEPELVDEGLFGTMLTAFFSGVRELAGTSAAA